MQTSDSDKNNDLKSGRKLINNYARFSALGFQMIAIIGAFAYAGYVIDEKKQTETPLYTAFLTLFGVFAALYLVIRSVKKLKP